MSPVKECNYMKTISQLLIILGVAVLYSCSQKPDSSAGTQTTIDSTATGNQVIETIMARRSIRKYKPQQIEPEKVQQIIKCGIFAPNGRNKESWEVRVVDNPKLIAEIDSLYNKYTQEVTKIKAAMHHATYGAPMIVFIAYDTTYDVSPVDCGLLGGNMLLAAQSIGIGSCCLGGIARFMNSPEATDLLKRLQLPDTHKLLYAIVFGYSDESPTPKERDMNKVKFIN